jgi:hypothetical protein
MDGNILFNQRRASAGSLPLLSFSRSKLTYSVFSARDTPGKTLLTLLRSCVQSRATVDAKPNNP